MWTRRQVFFDGALAVGFASGCGCACAAAPDRIAPEYGCSIPERELDKVYPRSMDVRLVTGREPMIPTSDDREFDYALAQTLGKICSTFDVAPGFAYFDDHDGPNAYASPSVRLNGADGTVLFGLRLLRLLRAGPEHPEVSVASVCAHEFGHILQYKRGLMAKVRNGATTVKRTELQADFFAGYFAGMRKKERPEFPAAVFATTQHGAGDQTFFSPGHHGTPDERAAAIVRGFEASFRSNQPLAEAIEVSTTYYSNL